MSYVVPLRVRSGRQSVDAESGGGAWADIPSDSGGTRPAVDIPWLVNEYLDGHLLIDELISARRPLEEAESNLTDLARGHALRQLLIP